MTFRVDRYDKSWTGEEKSHMYNKSEQNVGVIEIPGRKTSVLSVDQPSKW